MDRIKELEAELARERKAKRDKELEEIYSQTEFRIGDHVEFLENELDCDDGSISKTIWKNGLIDDIKVNYKGEIIAYIKYYYDDILIHDLNLYKENDYTLRHSVWNRELDIEDEFQLIADRPKSTKFNIYKIYKKVKEVGMPIEYWYYNDYDKPQVAYPDEIHVITPITDED